MNIAVCDDDRYFRLRVTEKIKRHFAAKAILVTVDSFCSAVDLLRENVAQYDIIFLDVSMPNVDGIDAGRVIAKKSPHTMLVYVSGLIEYAPTSHEIETTVRYLLKTQFDDKFNECMNTLLKRLNYQNKKVMVCFTEGEMAVYRHEILFMETHGHLVTFHFSSPKKEPLHSRKYTLTELLSFFGESLFVKIDQSCIVNMSYISEITSDQHGNKCVLNDGTFLYISQRRYKEAKRHYFLFKGGI